MAPQDVFEQLGIDSRNCGCVMLSVKPKQFVIPEEWLYYDDTWTRGGGMEEYSHVTLRYGITDPKVNMDHINTVLEGLRNPPEDLFVAGLDRFENDRYDVIKLDLAGGWESINYWLYAANARLQMLPGINTFPNYTPHVTIAYTKKGWYEQHRNLQYPAGYVKTGDIVYSPAREVKE